MKIGIYEGSIPPPVFINNLITGLANSGLDIYLYGKEYNRGNDYQITSIYLRSFPQSKPSVILKSLTNMFSLILKKKYPSYKLLKSIYISAGGLRRFFIRCNRILPVFLDELDVLHFQWAKMLVGYPEFINFLKCPIVLSLRGAHINYSPLADKKLLNNYKTYFPEVDMFHAVSKAIAKESQKYSDNQKKIKVIYPAVDNNLFNLNITSVNYYQDKRLEIISVGRCHWKKGFTIALDAMALLKKQNINFHYTLIAAGEDKENISYQISDLELIDNVTFINGLPHNEVVKKLVASNLFLLPSIEEGISNAVLEAMAIGVPVITTNCGGMYEVIQNNENGFIVSIRDSMAITEGVLNFIKMTPNEISYITKNAKKTIMESHLLDQQVKKMINLYHEILTV